MLTCLHVYLFLLLLFPQIPIVFGCVWMCFLDTLGFIIQFANVIWGLRKIHGQFLPRTVAVSLFNCQCFDSCLV